MCILRVGRSAIRKAAANHSSTNGRYGVAVVGVVGRWRNANDIAKIRDNNAIVERVRAREREIVRAERKCDMSHENNVQLKYSLKSTIVDLAWIMAIILCSPLSG